MSRNIACAFKKGSIQLALTDYDDYVLVGYDFDDVEEEYHGLGMGIYFIGMNHDTLFNNKDLREKLAREGIEPAHVNRIMRIDFLNDNAIFDEGEYEYLDEESRENILNKEDCVLNGKIEICYQYSELEHVVAFAYKDWQSIKSIVYRAIAWRKNYEY